MKNVIYKYLLQYLEDKKVIKKNSYETNNNISILKLNRRECLTNNEFIIEKKGNKNITIKKSKNKNNFIQKKTYKKKKEYNLAITSNDKQFCNKLPNEKKKFSIKNNKLMNKNKILLPKSKQFHSISNLNKKIFSLNNSLNNKIMKKSNIRKNLSIKNKTNLTSYSKPIKIIRKLVKNPIVSIQSREIINSCSNKND